MHLSRLPAFVLPLLLAVACSPQPAAESDVRAAEPAALEEPGTPEPSLALVDGEIFVPLSGRDVTAGFGRLSAGRDDITLLSVTAPFAQAVEMHTHSMDEAGRMAMRQVEAFSVPGGQELALARGGDHLMFFGVAPDALVPGEEVTLTAQVRRGDGQTETVDLKMQVLAR